MPAKTAKIAVSAATYWVDKPYDYLIPEQLLPSVRPGVRVTIPFGRGNRRAEGIVLAFGEAKPDQKLKCVETVLDSEPVLDGDMLRLAMWMRERFFCTVYDAVKAMLPAGLWYSIRSVYSIAEGVDRAMAYDSAGKSARESAVLDVLFANEGKCELRTIESAFGEQSPNAALSSLVKKGVIAADAMELRRIRDKTVASASLAVPAEEAMEIARQKKRRAPHQAAVLELMCTVGRAAVKEISYFTGCTSATVNRLAKDGYLAIEAQEVYRSPITVPEERAPLPVLNDSQQSAYEGILMLTKRNEARCALLFGVTGSGKTTIYIRLIADMLAQGRGAILLVPEISLTPQMIAVFSSHFGSQVAVLHSSLAIGERYDEWKRIRRGEAKVVIGTRSAVFAPVQELGLIIIDEEQEDTYKSENPPRYHARDVAKYRCAASKALLLLGSATPDVESRYYADRGKYAYFTLAGRYNEMALPQVRIVDMKMELRAGNGGSISSVLRAEIQRNLDRGEQTILFLNRRGTNKLITCAECGYTYQCPRCSVSLTYHSANRRLMCHYCGYSVRVDERCPDCGGALSYIGAGTQKVVEELEELFPNTEILRMDADSVAPAGSHEALLNRFRQEKIPIMVGTQMVTKGLNFENVTLVGVISADQSLYAGDYRSGERTFSLITQVVGRSGRGDKPGRAVIQTLTPENQTILQAARQDYDSFYQSEIYLREMLLVPPFAELYAVTASGADEAAVVRCCAFVRDRLREALGKDARVLGPAPLPVVRVNNRYRYRVTVSGGSGAAIRGAVSGLLNYCNTAKEFRGVSLYADLNPGD
ncbi:MAG: replication restart helicase PriA [Candidatus Heteroscillospira sp.]|jgi:primosomal protein N' (replication factor Y)